MSAPPSLEDVTVTVSRAAANGRPCLRELDVLNTFDLVLAVERRQLRTISGATHIPLFKSRGRKYFYQGLVWGHITDSAARVDAAERLRGYRDRHA